MTSDHGAVLRAREACEAIAEEYREAAAFFRLSSRKADADEQERLAAVADRCAAAVEVQR